MLFMVTLDFNNDRLMNPTFDTELIFRLVVYVVCRRGNDSQRAVKLLKEKFADLDLVIKDIEGGLHAWARDVDRSFPVY